MYFNLILMFFVKIFLQLITGLHRVNAAESLMHKGF